VGPLFLSVVLAGAAAVQVEPFRHHIPGMSAALVHRRAVAWSQGFGHADLSAAGEISSTVLDLAKFDVALDGDRLISAASRERMFTPAVSSSGQTLPYALGWFVEEIAGRRVMWHYGWAPPGVSALYVKVPGAELTFLLLANNDRLSAGFAWSRQGVRASPFARAFLDAFDLAGG
jgi:CubicO group peptidase (beta-lactamase class C family)